MAYRKNLEDLINENGGEYRGNLTRDVTHLVAKEPTGQKYSYAGQWGIKVVSVEWLSQSLERGMILDESLFNLLLPPAERGRNAWIRQAVPTTTIGKRPREGGLERTNSRKLRRTASARLSNESSGLWTDIVGDLIKQETEKTSERFEPSDVNIAADINHGKVRALQTSGEQRFREEPAAYERQNPVKTPSIRSGGIFEGTKIVLHGFDQKRVGLPQCCSSSINHHVLDCHPTTSSLFPWC